jgi:hypothetical protein
MDCFESQFPRLQLVASTGDLDSHIWAFSALPIVLLTAGISGDVYANYCTKYFREELAWI